MAGGREGRMRRVGDADVAGKTVLVRVDFNVPIRGTDIQDDARIRAAVPTIDLLAGRGARVVLLTHLGQPDGKVVESLRVDPLGARLSELLGRAVRKLDDCVGDGVEKAIAAGAPGDVFLLENVRFHRGEEENAPEFAAALSALGDLYVNDAFGALHRAHATMVGLAERLPAFAGLLVEAEIDVLSRLLEAPERPYLAIVGGKKAESKLGALSQLASRVDAVLIGGGVAATFRAALRPDAEETELVKRLRQVDAEARRSGTAIVLPRDAVVAPDLRSPEKAVVADVAEVPAGWTGFDIGPATVREFEAWIAKARSIVWAGPMGAFEVPPFDAGTRGVAEAVARSSSFSVIGGGETGEALAAMGLADRVSFISTGGGACLAYLEGKRLPALAALGA
ncbi:MAG: phosphoglycerate kinase [Candidatus Bipolaricaulota bacterium]